MKSKKLLKAIATLAVGTVMVSGVAFSACETNKTPGGDNTTHTHHWSDWEEVNGTTHKRECDAEGCDNPTETGNHDTTGTDGACSKCGYKEGSVTPTGKATITFDTKGGSAVASQEIDKGTAVSKPADPTKEGHIFTGWYADANCTTIYDFTKLVTADSVTIYAGWRVRSKFDDLTEASNKIISEDFSTTTSIEKGGFSGTAGIYWSQNEKSGATDTTNYAKVENGYAVLVDESAGATELYIDFGHVTGTVEAYLEVVLTNAGNSWTPFQFYGSKEGVENGEIIGIRFDGGKMKYRLNTSNSGLTADGDVSWADGTTYGIYYKVDLTTGKVTIEVNGTKIANEVAVGATALQGIKLTTSDGQQNGKARGFASIDYIAVAADGLSVTEYAEAQAAKFEAKYNNLTDDVLGDLSTDVPVATHKNNIASAASYDAVDAAYKAGVTACDAKILENAKSVATTQIDGHRSGESFTQNAEALETAKTNAKTAIGAATTVDSVKTALSEGKAAIDLIENDTQAAKATITVQINASLDGVDKGKIGETTFKSGESISVEDIKAACDETSYTIVGLYNELACTSEITGSYTKTASSSETVTIYAKVTEKDDFTAAGTYTYAPVSKKPTPSENAPEGMFSWNETDTGNASDFKFGSNTTAITITLKLKAGQTVALTLTDVFTGSSGNASGVKVAATGSVTTSDPTSYDTSSDNTVKASYTINYTANADGEVVLTITRNVSKTLRITSLSLVVA